MSHCLYPVVLSLYSYPSDIIGVSLPLVFFAVKKCPTHCPVLSDPVYWNFSFSFPIYETSIWDNIFSSCEQVIKTFGACYLPKDVFCSLINEQGKIPIFSLNKLTFSPAAALLCKMTWLPFLWRDSIASIPPGAFLLDIKTNCTFCTANSSDFFSPKWKMIERVGLIEIR